MTLTANTPYGVPASSVLNAPEPKQDTPLAPFEERTLQYLINQFKGSTPRIRKAFLVYIADFPEFHAQ